MQPDDPRLVAAARHALHDEELIAAFAVDGEAAEDALRAQTLIERCTTCRDLHADLVAIGSTIRATGSAESIGALRYAPRDFQLSASDAVRLRGGNVLQRVGARLRDGVATFGRPVGASLATLGVIGLLVGTMALAPLGGPAAMTMEDAGAGGAAPGATFVLSGGNQALSSPPGDRAALEPAASGRDSGGNGVATLDDGRPGPAPLMLLFAGSIAVLVFGAGLLLVNARGRQRAAARATTRTGTRT